MGSRYLVLALLAGCYGPTVSPGTSR